MTGQTQEVTPDQQAEGGKQEQAFTQADVDRIVRERVQRERAKYADYDDLKVKAGEKQTVDQQLAELREQLTATKTEATRASVAARFGISTEPGTDGSKSDAELFLTGSDEETLVAQAQRLAAREAERKQNGNHVPREGQPPSNGKTSDLRTFAQNLFNPDA